MRKLRKHGYLYLMDVVLLFNLVPLFDEGSNFDWQPRQGFARGFIPSRLRASKIIPTQAPRPHHKFALTKVRISLCLCVENGTIQTYWYTANIVIISVFNALLNDSGLVAAVILCEKREEHFFL